MVYPWMQQGEVCMSNQRTGRVYNYEDLPAMHKNSVPGRPNPSLPCDAPAYAHYACVMRVLIYYAKYMYFNFQYMYFTTIMYRMGHGIRQERIGE